MRSRPVTAAMCSLALVALCATIAPGCASLQAKLNAKLLDYASAEQDARITVSGTNDGFSARNLIDGVTKVDVWNADAGWEYSFERSGIRSGGSAGSIEGNMTRGSAWALIEFPEVRRVNRIAVHTYNTIEMPSAGIVSGLAQVRTPEDIYSPWKTIGQIEKGYLIIPGKQATRVRPTTTFRFNQVDADAVRVVIFSMGDSVGVMADDAETDSRYRANSTQETTVRLVEIEVTGSASAAPAPPPGN
jgi:hypothetical protein